MNGAKAAGKGARSSKRNRDLLSCTECHRRKQKCNRLLPCNDCTQRGVPQKCEYKAPVSNQAPFSVGQGTRNGRLRRIINGSEVVLTPESIDALQFLAHSDLDAQPKSAEILGYHNLEQLTGLEWPVRAPVFYYPNHDPVSTPGLAPGVDPWFLGGIEPFSALPEVNGGPIPVELLVSHFIRVLAPWLSSYDDSLTPSSPRISWFPYALNHLPLFYGTLLCAAVHLDRKQPFGDQSKLLWYKAETMRLANEKLSILSEGASDQMILVALILLYFNVKGNNPEEYDIHLGGINQMLHVRGGIENLGMTGMVKNWIAVCHGPWSPGWTYGQFRIKK